MRALARDYEITRKMSEANVMVEVQDTNDNSPIFTQKDYKISVLESAKPSRIVLNVRATDMDSSSTEQEVKRGYGEVRYSLVGENANMFEVEPITGNIQVNEFILILFYRSYYRMLNLYFCRLQPIRHLIEKSSRFFVSTSLHRTFLKVEQNREAPELWSL